MTKRWENRNIEDVAYIITYIIYTAPFRQFKCNSNAFQILKVLETHRREIIDISNINNERNKIGEQCEHMEY